MTIGWGTLGIIWEKPLFLAYVRQQRYTREMLDECREFTINVSIGEYRRKILGICGSKSVRDMDKIAEAVEPEVINVPGIKELPLTLECRVLYRQEQESDQFNEEITRKFYTIETGDHICYYGEIVSAYIIEDKIAYEKDYDYRRRPAKDIQYGLDAEEVRRRCYIRK